MQVVKENIILAPVTTTTDLHSDIMYGVQTMIYALTKTQLVSWPCYEIHLLTFANQKSTVGCRPEVQQAGKGNCEQLTSLCHKLYSVNYNLTGNS